MRILAIRGRNLASLAAPFDVNFGAPPLECSGLFAITGPTGAGKSTILDALCLALYDRIPRLERAGGGAVGRSEDGEGLAGNDVRGILRHGATEALAEVDFVGRDGGEYRATWRVNRARGRADGKLQAQSLSLVSLSDDGSRLGGGKRETLAAIVDKTGLDYDQFRRSVLLAQNDFDAFLKADAKERAALLEQMTGTEIYSRLSVAAFERAKAERLTLQALEGDLGRLVLLNDEDRAALIETAVATETRIAAIVAEGQVLEAAAGWHRQHQTLARDAAAAAARLAEAQAADQAAEPDRLRLAEVRRAQACRTQVEEADRLAAEEARLATEEQRQDQARQSAEAALAGAVDAMEAAQRRAEAAEDAFKQAGPLLDQAAKLDAQIDTARQEAEAAQAEAVRLDATAKIARATLDGQVQARQECSEKLEAAEAWLVGHAAHGPVADQLGRWLEAITAHAKAAAERRRAETEAGQAGSTVATLTEQDQALRQQDAALGQQEGALQTTISALRDSLAAIDVPGLERRRDCLSSLNAALASLEGLAGEGETLATRQRILEQQAAEATACAAKARNILAEINSQRIRTDTALAEARRALDLGEAAESKQAVLLRARLIDGEPCPVCGAREHPVEAAATGLVALVEEQRRRVLDLETGASALTDQRQERVAEQKAAETTLSRAEQDMPVLAAEIARCRRKWSTARDDAATHATVLAIVLPTLPDDPLAGCDAAVLDRLRADVEADAERVAGVLAEAAKLRQDLDSSGAERDRLGDQRRALADELGDTGIKLSDARQARAQAERDGQRAEAECLRLAAVLENALAVVADGDKQLMADPDAVAETLRSLADTWRQRVTDQRGLQDRHNELHHHIALAEEAVRAADTNARAGRATAEKREQALAGLVTERAALFGDRPTREVRTDLNEARKRTGVEQDGARKDWAEKTAALVGAETTWKRTIQQLSETRQARAQADATLQARLETAGLDLAAIREALALGEPWIEQVTGRLETLRENLASAEAVDQERRRMLAEHEQTGRPEIGAEDIPTRKAELDKERAVLQDRQDEQRTRLRDDNRNRTTAEDLGARIASQRQASDVWQSLSEVIGSASGDKFRRFAQTLTLEHLIALANTHLAELTPRYRLEAVPGGELDLQVVDRDMGNDVRGVANLSGGERFLVSLSLALGLASMSGHRTRIESLFIDEGFGALDATSLDIALSALEALQASGRKVGVISHVQAMVERIGAQVRISKLGGGRSVVETI